MLFTMIKMFWLTTVISFALEILVLGLNKRKIVISVPYLLSLKAIVLLPSHPVLLSNVT